MNVDRLRSVIRQIKMHASFKWIVLMIIGVVMYVAMINLAMPNTVHVKLHEVAKQDIQSPIEIVDQQTTDAYRKQAVANTPTSYVFNKDEAMIQVEKVDDIFNTLQDLRTQSSQVQENKGKDDKETKAEKAASLEEELKSARKKLDDTAGDQLSDNTIKTLLTISDHDFAAARDMISSTIYDTMSNKIKWTTLEDAQKKALRSIPASLVSENLNAALQDLIRLSIVPNYVLDAKATKRNKEEAAKSVEPVVIHQGEVIVKKGDLVTRDTLHKLQVVGLLNNHLNLLPFVGLAILVAFLTAMIALEIHRDRRGETPPNMLAIYLCIFILDLIIIKVGEWLKFTHITSIGLIIPVACGPLLITLLLSRRLAVVSSLVFAICTGFIYGGGSTATGLFDYSMALFVLFSSLAGASVLRGAQDRPKLLQTGVIIAFVNMLTVICLLLLKNGSLHFLNVGLPLAYGLISAFLATVLAIGLLPFFEAVFGILSTMRLIELSNPNHPLLRKILMEAPGTYHHSLMVANLAERACEVIGANGLLARVAAYYHDIGKTKRPRFFIENQMNGMNPHDKISPRLSATIIISHPYDGSKVLKEHKMPKEIIDIAEQHHGTTLLKFFYHKACEEIGEKIPESDFRYPGPKAQTPEAAVVEIADSVEAAVRSMTNPTKEKIEALVQNIINDRLEDGQFDECDITMKELHQVKESLCETLNGVFHSRIEYPDEEDHAKKSG
ncbi:HD family phosphohydrolase [Camelliibacillus cellulosilyticus]|uniref:HD family phosphohydrolase n=1 Tax=Camelliibacillus cellulosilyticus TaxID=2174486 RepID=A0ABV9GMB9_9BACL